MEKLEERFPGYTSFLCNSGAEAIEGALKLLLFLRPERPRMLALRRSFHGRTLGALSLTFNPRYRRPWQRALLPVEHLEPQELLEALDDRVAGVFVEPLQGEGGLDMLNPEYCRTLRQRCSEVGALLGVDEIQTGWGRCGALSLAQQWGMAPDILCFAKGDRRGTSRRHYPLEEGAWGLSSPGARLHLRRESSGGLGGPGSSGTA